MFGDNTRPKMPQNQKKGKILLLKRLLLACFSMSFCDKSMTTLDDRLSVARLSVTRLTYLTPPFCCEALRRAPGALKPYLPFCRETFRRATGALTALPWPFRSFFASAAFSASITPKLSSNLTVLGSVLLKAQIVAFPPSTRWDMEYFYTPTPHTGSQNKHFRGTLVQHGAVYMYVCR